MRVLKTKFNTFIIQMEKDESSTDIISDCFNSRLYLYHFPNQDDAEYIMNKFLAANDGDEIEECFNLIPEYYSII